MGRLARAGNATLSAVIALTFLSIYYSQVRLGHGAVIAGITGLLSLLTSLGAAGGHHRDDALAGIRPTIEYAIQCGVQASLATALAGLVSAPWPLTTLAGVVTSALVVGQHARTLRQLLADRVADQPQVKAAGLNPDELSRLRDEVRATSRRRPATSPDRRRPTTSDT